MGNDMELVPGRTRSGPQKRAANSRSWSKEKQATFIEVLADSCNVKLACQAIGGGITTAYRLRAKDASFRQAWDQALAIGYAKLEMMMLERALHGVEKEVKLRGGESRIMRQYNDRMALALLRQHRETVAHVEAQADEEEYQAACERIIEKLAKLRAREEGAERTETKTSGDRLALIALALKVNAANGAPANADLPSSGRGKRS